MINSISISEYGKYYGGKNSFDRELISLDDAAELAGTSKQYICKLIANERIDSVKLPARLIDKNSLMRELEK